MKHLKVKIVDPASDRPLDGHVRVFLPKSIDFSPVGKPLRLHSIKDALKFMEKLAENLKGKKQDRGGTTMLLWSSQNWDDEKKI
jgi:hypothetical protein